MADIKIQSIPPKLILLHCLNPILRVSKCLGLFPIQFHKDGSAEHNWFSKLNIYSILFLSAAIFLSAVYIPFLMDTLDYLNQWKNMMEYVAQVIFLSGQYITGMANLIMIHVMAPSLSRTWNQLQDIVVVFGTEPTSTRYFRRVQFWTSFQAFCWLVLLAFFIFFYTIYSWDFLLIKFVRIDFIMIVFIIGFGAFCLLIAGHLILTWVFLDFIWMLVICLTILRKSVLTKVYNFETFAKYYNSYCTIEELNQRFGSIFGVYIIIQIILMITSTLVNLYFAIYMNEHTSPGLATLIGPPTMVVVYVVWLLVLCNSGERFQVAAIQAVKSLVESAAFNLTPEGNLQAVGLLANLSGRPSYVTAANFIKINRRAMTKIFALMTTYLIFLIQFKVDLSRAPVDGDHGHPPDPDFISTTSHPVTKMDGQSFQEFQKTNSTVYDIVNQ